MDAVIDASALLKRVILEPETAALSSWIRESVPRLHAPALIAWEAGNVLRGKQVNQAEAKWRHLLLEVRIHGAHAGTFDVGPAALTFCDAAYLDLAGRLGCPLVTYDEKLAEASESVGVEVLAPS